MGVLLSVLCSYMGAVELMFIVRDLTHQLALHQSRLGNDERKQSDLSVLQDKIKASIDALETIDIESVEQMQDGVLYQNGYRIENEQTIKVVAQQWDERRKVMSVAEMNTVESQTNSNNDSVGKANSSQIQPKTMNEYDSATGNGDSSHDDEANEQNNYRPIVRDDRTGRRKAFKKRNSSSSQSDDSIRVSREEELKMFTSLEEEEYKNSSYTPISYSNLPVHEKNKYDVDAWNKKPSNYHDSELWKRERATSIVEETEDNSSNTKHISSDKMSGISGTADKRTKKPSCENDNYASNACDMLNKVDNNGLCTLNLNDAKLTEECVDKHLSKTIEPDSIIKKIDNLPNLNQYFNDALESDLEPKKNDNADTITQIVIDKPSEFINSEKDADPIKPRDARSSTVYSRSDSENSIIFSKSISRDSSSALTDSTDRPFLRQSYNRTDSSNSFIQDELDSEEYHHNHRFSMTAETLEYIRGRDDWRAHTENNLNNLYSRQSSNISIRDEIDSDEYHHDRKLSDLIEIAYLDTESIKSLPSSYEENKVFDRYYLELQQINGQLSSDIEQNIAQKQVILLDAREIEATEGYLYPLPDIIIDQVIGNGDELYATEQVDSDYSNVSESEDDIQSVIEVNHGSTYEGEIITTLDMDGDDDEMIEVSLWDLKDDVARELSSKESSVEIISISNENISSEQVYAKQSDEVVLTLVSYNEEIAIDVNETIDTINSSIDVKNITTEDSEFLVDAYLVTKEEIPSNFIETESTIAENVSEQHMLLTDNERTENSNYVTNDRSKNIETETAEEGSEGGNVISDLGTPSNPPADVDTSKDEGISEDTNDKNCHIEESPTESETTIHIEIDDPLATKLDQNSGIRPSSVIEMSEALIEHEKLTSAPKEVASHSRASHNAARTSNSSEKPKRARRVGSYKNVDDLIQEGCMGVWFHN